MNQSKELKTYPDNTFNVKKDDFLFLVVSTVWALTIIYFNPRLFILLIGPENLFAKICMALFIICLDIFWFYAIFHMTILTFSYFQKSKEVKLKPAIHSHPKVAVLYVTYNDFQNDAVLSCLRQEYKNFKVFILDDSTDLNYIKKIDSFVAVYKDKVRIIRRNNRKAFKAGNLNHGLKLISDDYDFFAVCDADSILANDFIKKLLPYFYSSEKVGFVQAINRINPKQSSYLAEAMGFSLELHYKRYILPRQKYGFIMFHGHGGMIRTSAWKEVDGFPEIVSEDLGFSSRLRIAGYFGLIAENCVCDEEYPPTYRHYRKRIKKWVKGTLEFLFKEYPAFFKTKSISWFEKFDVFVSGLSLTLGFPFLIFILLGGIALPIFYSSFRTHGPVFIPAIPEGKTTVSMLTGLRFNAYWTYDFYILMLITIFYPLIPVLIDLIKKPMKMFRYMVVSTYLFLGTMLWISFQTLSYIFQKKVDFLVTAHESLCEQNKKGLFVGDRTLKSIIILEFALSVIFAIFTISSNNLWLITICIALLLSPFLLIFDFKKRVMRHLLAIPFILSLLLLILISKSVIIE